MPVLNCIETIVCLLAGQDQRMFSHANPNNPLGLPRYKINKEKLKVVDTPLAWDSYDKEFLRHMGQAKVSYFVCFMRPNI